MAKNQKQAEGSDALSKTALTRRYESIADIKREFFPNAAAEDEAMTAARLGDGAYEALVDEFFVPEP